MKKTFLSLLSLCLAASSLAHVQVDTDFECDSIPAGWTVVLNTESGYKGGYSIVTYDGKETSLDPKNVGTNDLGGNYALRSLTGGKNKVKGNSDNWLISPAFTVADSCHVFSFRLAANCSYSPTKDSIPEKMKMDIVIISQDSTVVATIAPENYFSWKQYAFDLSAYANQTIQVAFHDYGKQGSGAVGDMKYIDNICLSGQKSSDYVIAAQSTLYGQAQYTADLTVNVANYGCAQESFNVCYQIGDATPVSEKVDSVLSVGKSVNYTFQKAPVFEPGDTVSFKVWVEVAGDAMSGNDSLPVQTILAAAKQSLPYAIVNELNDEDDSNNDLILTEFSTATGSSSAKWSYDKVKYNAWIYSLSNVSKTGLGYLYTTKAFTLPAGKVLLKTIGTATFNDNYYEVYIAQYGAKEMAGYATKVGQSDTLRNVTSTQTIDTTTVELTIPAAGDYILGIRPMTATRSAQMTIIGYSLVDPAATAIVTCSNGQDVPSSKCLFRGQLCICRNGKTYDLCGKELK